MCAQQRLKSTSPSTQSDLIFVVCMKNLYLIGYPKWAQWRLYQTAWMHTLIWIFPGLTCQMVHFLILWLKYYKYRYHCHLPLASQPSHLPLILHDMDTVFTSTSTVHAYSYILKILQPKNENFQIKNSDIFHISAQNIDCEYSLEAKAVLMTTHNLCFLAK